MIYNSKHMNIVHSVEHEIEYEFDSKEVVDVFNYTKRKCEVIGKDDSYFPILFRNELIDHVTRKKITSIGDILCFTQIQDSNLQKTKKSLQPINAPFAISM